jgi:Flp pilus assembly protein TadG
VFVLVLLLPLAFGILQLALVLHVRNTLAAAAAEGARAGAVLGAPPGAAVATTRQQIVGAVDARFADGVRAGTTTIGGAETVVVTVRATVPTLGLGGPSLSFEVNGHAAKEHLPESAP